MKLKKEVYEEAAELTQSAMNAVEMLRVTMPSILQAGMERPEFHPRALRQWQYETAESALRDARTEVYQLMAFIDRRAIMHPGLYIFRLAFKREFFHVEMHHNGYWHLLSRDWAAEIFDERARGVLLGDVGSFHAHTWHLLNYIRDFTIEMQNLLLGELFDRTVDHRTENRDFVIRLADHAHLRPRFEETQEWEHPVSTPPPRQNSKS